MIRAVFLSLVWFVAACGEGRSECSGALLRPHGLRGVFVETP